MYCTLLCSTITEFETVIGLGISPPSPSIAHVFGFIPQDGAGYMAKMILLTSCTPPSRYVWRVSDCAVCTYGYGRGFNNACHSCNDANGPLLVAAGTMFFLVMLLLVSLAVVFLIGGLDAIDTVHQSLTRTFSEAGPRTAPRDAIGSPAFDFVLAKKTAKIGPRVNSLDETVVPRFCLESEVGRCGGAGVDGSRSVSSSTSDPLRSVYRTHVGPLGVADGAAIECSNVASRNSPGKEDSRAPWGAQRLPMAAISVRGPQSSPEEDVDSTLAGTSKCCGIGKRTKHWISILPLNKLKILVVVWQILAIGSTITGVEFPDSYACFLSWISVVNLDIGNIFSASCLLPSVNFYVRLLVTTLSPLVLAAVLVLTYRMAKRRAGIGRAGVIARRAAWSRHVAAGLLLTFLVRFDEKDWLPPLWLPETSVGMSMNLAESRQRLAR